MKSRREHKAASPSESPSNAPPAKARRTDAQRQAARKNGAQSRGPKTPQGKDRSRQNALKHGMAGAGVVLPDDLQRELETEVQLFERSIKPRNHVEQRLVERAALASLRWTRLARVEHVMMKLRVQNANAPQRPTPPDADFFKHTRALEPNASGHPAPALAALKCTAEGCQYLADAWARLAEVLDMRPCWTQTELCRAGQLLGHTQPLPDTIHDTPELHAFWHVVLASRARSEPQLVDQWARRIYEIPTDRLHALLPAADAAPSVLKRHVRGFQTSLQREAARLQAIETRCDSDPAARSELAVFDDGESMAKLSRYLNDADRTSRMALNQIDRMRRDERIRREREDGSEEGKWWAAQSSPPSEPPAPAPESLAAKKRIEPGATQPQATPYARSNRPAAPAAALLALLALLAAWILGQSATNRTVGHSLYEAGFTTQQPVAWPMFQRKSNRRRMTNSVFRIASGDSVPTFFPSRLREIVRI